MYKVVKTKVRDTENYVIRRLIVQPNLKLTLLKREGDVSLASINQLYYGFFKSS
ncbi:hypothetical protein WH47_12460 [Habropoda laboriosa]|uniref:Uncharacterized protein n=1 Tax=Habropoda laboriosa TaxID=597456 RepID=A0A0L7QZY8_9HYME|nr:hypothetical protein WH47_12460 [Habropoda laboriosa]